MKNMNRLINVLALGALVIFVSTSFKSLTTKSFTVSFTELENNNGKLAIRLYDGEVGFPEGDDSVYKDYQVSPSNYKATLSLKDIPYGTYAIAVLHDEDENGELKKGFLGIPQEGIGMSNNPGFGLSAPSWEECKFTVNAETEKLSIELVYY